MKLTNDLLNPKNYNRTQYELEEFLLLCVFVAGKSSKTQSEKLSLFIEKLKPENGIFNALAELSIEEIKDKLIEVKAGQYNRLSGCLFMLSRKQLDLNNCSCEELESIPGIGMKTSRFFVTYSRPETNYAILDTHILAWLRNYYPEAPRSTPTNRKEYAKYEKFFLSECLKRNLKPHELDLQIWKEKQKSWKV